MWNYYPSYPAYNCSDNYFLGVDDILSLFWILLVAWLVVLILKRLFGHQPTSTTTNNFDNGVEAPIYVLKMRYAKGEITKNEFESIKTDII